MRRALRQPEASCPRGAWERNTATLCVVGGADGPRSGGVVRYHAERGNESRSLPQSPVPNPHRRGLTLIELLVVIVILVTLVAAAIPILAPANDDRRLREASRGVNAFISGALMKAISIQRPVGVALKRLSKETGRNKVGEENDNGVCLEMYYVEQPSPFIGFDENSSARLSIHTPANSNLYKGIRPLVLVQFLTRGNATPPSPGDGLPIGWDADTFPDGVVRPGDVIEINGTQYELLADVNDSIVPRFDAATNTFFASNTGSAGAQKPSQIVAHPVNDTGQMFNAKFDKFGNEVGAATVSGEYFFTYPSPYKILRQPAPSSAPPYQLPEGTAIDLRASGVGIEDYFYVPDENDNDQQIVIMFAPEGRISRVTYSQEPVNGTESSTFDQSVVDNLFLLVGNRENAPPPDVATDPTLASAKLPPSGSQNREQLLQELKKPVNWLRGESRWIVIGAQSGRVVTVENAFVDPAAVITKYVAPPNVTESSEALRNRQIFTARDITKEMKQLGGR